MMSADKFNYMPISTFIMKNLYGILLLNVFLIKKFALSNLTEAFTKLPNDDRFGVKNTNTINEERIIGGALVNDLRLYPYQAQYGDKCAAAIIDKRWAITAAHCGHSTVIKAGSLYIYTGPMYLILRHHLHPLWLGDNKLHTYDYDFQLLELEQDIIFNEKVQAIAIGHIDDLFVGKILTVTGWGHTKFNGRISFTLKVIKIPIASKIKCQKLDFPFYRHTLTPRMFCAGSDAGGDDACQGDSGGPATANNKLYGLVSFGFDCGLPNVYGVYANVVRERKWIEDTVTFNAKQ